MLTGQVEGSTAESSQAIPGISGLAAMAGNDAAANNRTIAEAGVVPGVMPAPLPEQGDQTQKASTLENANNAEDGGIIAAAAPNGAAATWPGRFIHTPELTEVDSEVPMYHEHPAPFPELNFTMAHNSTFDPPGAYPRAAAGNVSFIQPETDDIQEPTFLSTVPSTAPIKQIQTIRRNFTDNSTSFEAEADENVKVPRHSAIDGINVPAGLMDEEEAATPETQLDTEESQLLLLMTESAAPASDGLADKFGAVDDPATAQHHPEGPSTEDSSPLTEMASPSPAAPARTIIPYLPFLGQTSQVRENEASAAQTLQFCSSEKAASAIHCAERSQ